MGEVDYKRKWQIALRRYIIEERPAFEYAPYFGIDNKGFRKWMEGFFKSDMDWSNFGKNWQIDHVAPLFLFNLAEEAEKKLCWNFVNIQPTSRIESEYKPVFDLSGTVSYFEKIYTKTGYPIAAEMITKLKTTSLNAPAIHEKNILFLEEQISFLNEIKNFGNIEMELVNKGRSPYEASEEAKNIRRLSSL